MLRRHAASAPCVAGYRLHAYSCCVHSLVRHCMLTQHANTHHADPHCTACCLCSSPPQPYIVSQHVGANGRPIVGRASVYTTHYTLVSDSNGTATGLAWDRTQQQRMNPGVPNGWLFETKQQVTKYQGGGTNAVDAGFLATDGEPVCAILSVVYDLEAFRRNQSDPTIGFEGASYS